MDPITHALVGLATGAFSGDSNILANPLALGCLVGSVIPDGDIVFQYWGDYAYLKNHRGMTHSLPGMLAISALAALLINALFPGNTYMSILLWTFLGCLTHVGLDIFNSYGAKLFWPFYDKKVGNGLLLIFDPFLILCTGVVYWFNRSNLLYTILSIGLFGIYLFFRQYRKNCIAKVLMNEIDAAGIQKVVLLPSMSGLFYWDFIIYCEQEIITGKIDTWGRNIKIRDRFQKSEKWVRELVMGTGIGKFFGEFTQEYHINCESRDQQHHITLIDLRYYIKNRYMHHATVLFNDEMKLVKSAFHPYHSGRNSKTPA